MKEDYIIVIPYIKTEAQGRELEYAVAGWQRHFKERHTIVIVGDCDTAVMTSDGVVFIDFPRTPPTDIHDYRPHIDMVRKFKAVHAVYPQSKGFIFACDDYYAINDFSIEDVKVLKYIPGGVDFDPNSPNPFRRDKMKTKRWLSSQGLPCRNFTTHLPAWYEWDKAEALWDMLGMERQSYVVEDTYFNYYYPVAGAVAIDGDDPYKCSVISTRPDAGRIKRAFTEKIWINNNPDGWCPLLDTMLREHFGL